MGAKKSKPVTTGELSQTNTANDQIKSIVAKVKADVEAEYGKEFETFDAVSFRKQVVAENVYFVKVNLGGEYAHIKVSVPIPEPSEKPAAKSAPTKKKTEEKKDETSEEKGEGSEEKGEGSEEKGEGSEEKGEGSEDAKDGEEPPAVVAEDKPEEKPSARFLAVQKGRKVNDDIVGFEVSEEAREEEEEEVKEETKEEEPKEEPKDEEPKEEPKDEEPKEEEPKEEEKAKEEEPKEEEEAKEEEKEDGDSSLLSTLKSEASDVGIPGF